MNNFTTICRAGLLTLSMGALLSICTQASAAVITAGDFAGVTPTAGSNPVNNATAVTTVLSSPFAAVGPGGINGTLLSQVFTNDPANTNGSAALTFVFQVQSTGSAIEKFTSNDFSSFATDVSYAPSALSDVAPTNANRPSAVTVGWSFASGLPGGDESALLIVRTDAKQFTVSDGSVIDGQVASGAVYGPFNSSTSPEPASLALLAGFGVLGLRRRK